MKGVTQMMFELENLDPIQLYVWSLCAFMAMTADNDDDANGYDVDDEDDLFGSPVDKPRKQTLFEVDEDFCGCVHFFKNRLRQIGINLYFLKQS